MIPIKPFPSYKWRWASYQPTESLNDPVILLGVLGRMRKLEQLPQRPSYNSPAFAAEMADLSKELQKANITVNLGGRTGSRNLIRNSGQYWRALGLLAPSNHAGTIALSNFGRKVADREISQSQFAAICIQTLTLPNPYIQTPEECDLWLRHGINLQPLKLILKILIAINESYQNESFMTPYELTHIVIPLAGVMAPLEEYVKCLLDYRSGVLDIRNWPNCIPGANDHRLAREFLLFLKNYGYLNEIKPSSKDQSKYYINTLIIGEIKEIVESPITSLEEAIGSSLLDEVSADLEAKRIAQSTQNRPNQARFRRDVLNACPRCIITNVEMHEVLQAAHIKPYAYSGADIAANGFAMRTDIHILFDSGNLRISTSGKIELSSKARMNYGASIPQQIVIPNYVDKKNLEWRWNNYHGY